ncbi:MAG: S8 family peptidase, partial [Vicinamibacterales bacterium]
MTTRTFKIGIWASAAITMAALLSPSPVLAQDKLDPVLRVRAKQLLGRSRVIVDYHGDADVRAITQRGGRAGRQLEGFHGQVAEIDNRVLAQLAADPRVAHVRPDRPAFVTMERTGAAIGAAVAREQFDVTGKGVGVAVIDSGITAWHDDLYYRVGKRAGAASRVVHFKDFTGPSGPSTWVADVLSDEFGHGTHVAGTVAGSGYDSDGRRSGIAPGANLIGLKVLDGEGHGYVSDVIAAIDYAIAVRRRYNIRVINLSVATGVFESYRTDPLAQAARRAVDAGIVVVTSAGNLGVDANGRPQFSGITCPGNAPWVLTVGASSHEGTAGRRDDILARFSSRGPTSIDRAAKPDIVAFGVGTESLSDPYSKLYSTNAAYLLSGTRRTWYKPYLSLSGTSMAAPVVAGTIALMLEANPDLTPNAVKAILEYTAEDRAESVLAEGAGLLNARGALRMSRFFTNPQRGLAAPGDTIEGQWTPWSQKVLWGNTLVAGGVPLPGSSAWNRNVEWGAETTATGQPVVWGAASQDDNIVWSTRDDDNIVWSTGGDDNIVWSTGGDDNIVWSTGGDDNIVWSTG